MSHHPAPRFTASFARRLWLVLALVLSSGSLLALPAATPGSAAPAQALARGKDDIGFLTGPAAGDPLDIALAYIRQQRGNLRLTSDDLSDVVVTDRYTTAHNGVTHLYLRQRLGGIEVYNGAININVTGDGRIINPIAAVVVVGGTAQAGSDYTTGAGSVTLPAGATSAGVAVTLLDDSADEGDETVQFTLTSAQGAALSTPTNATLTISDNDETAPVTTYEVLLPIVVK